MWHYIYWTKECVLLTTLVFTRINKRSSRDSSPHDSIFPRKSVSFSVGYLEEVNIDKKLFNAQSNFAWKVETFPRKRRVYKKMLNILNNFQRWHRKANVKWRPLLSQGGIWELLSFEFWITLKLIVIPPFYSLIMYLHFFKNWKPLGNKCFKLKKGTSPFQFATGGYFENKCLDAK